MQKTALILEGGGMRGVFTSGVLDFFMDQSLSFPAIYAVSAGACNAVSYMAGQRGRNAKINLDYINDKRYLSFSNLLRHRSLFGMDFIFEEIPKSLVPFDYEAFGSSKTDLVCVATDCETGKPHYISNRDPDFHIDAIRASSSLPLLSPIVDYHGKKLLDGGDSDSIPIAKCLDDGYERAVVVLTRPAGYCKQPNKLARLYKTVYRQYPQLAKTAQNRYRMYNRALDQVASLEAAGKVFVFRPDASVPISRFEKSRENLQKLYDNGYALAEQTFAALTDFLKD